MVDQMEKTLNVMCPIKYHLGIFPIEIIRHTNIMGIQAKQNDMYWNTNVCFTSGQNINLYIPKNKTNPTNEKEDKKDFFQPI